MSIPFYKLPEEVKQWARDNGFVVRETKSSAVTYSGWHHYYNKAHGL